MDEFIDLRFIIAGIVLLFGAAGAVLNWRKRAVARNWPMVVGTVEQASVNHGNQKFFPALLYSYQVNGEFYSGEHQLSDSQRSPEAALELAAPWLKKRIYLRYHPNDPQKSVYLPQDPFPP